MRNKESLLLMTWVTSMSRHGCKSPSSSPGVFSYQLVCILSRRPSSAKREENNHPAQRRGKGCFCHLAWRRLRELREAFSMGDTNNT